MSPWAWGITAPAGVLALALAIDLGLGEPPARLHPVVWMGHCIARLERAMPGEGAVRQLVSGALVAALFPLGCAALSWLALELLEPWPLARAALHAFLLTSVFAARALGQAALKVKALLEAAQLESAREALRSLCSRDASRLTPPELVAASVESVAENASDSFVAPLFYYALFGLPGAVFYRAVNTLDAMIGYHGRYEYTGKASARLDDALNFVPARLTAALLLLAGALSGADVRRGADTWLRDAASTESPNAGRPMATLAGLLRVCLEKPGHYRLGDPQRPLEPQHIADAWRIVQLTGALAALLAVGALLLWGGPFFVAFG